MLPSPAVAVSDIVCFEVRLQVTKYNLAFYADSTKYLLSRLDYFLLWEKEENISPPPAQTRKQNCLLAT